VERLGVPVYTPLPNTAEYLMQTYFLTAEQAGDGSPDVVWLLKEGIGEVHLYAAGDRLDVGVEAFPGQSHRTIVAGDTLVDFGRGLEINPRWLRPDMTREPVIEGLRPLLKKPVEHVLATHGGPYDRPPWSAHFPCPSRSRDIPAHSRRRRPTIRSPWSWR
jgi:hypothetical protein